MIQAKTAIDTDNKRCHYSPRGTHELRMALIQI